MKTLAISPQATEILELLEQARQEDVIVRSPDGTEFILTAVDAFDLELARTRQNTKLMAFLEERAKQTRTVALDEVKQQLGLTE